MRRSLLHSAAALLASTAQARGKSLQNPPLRAAAIELHSTG